MCAPIIRRSKPVPGGNGATDFLQATDFANPAFATICHSTRVKPRKQARGGSTMPKLLIFIGVALIGLGLLWMAAERLGVTPGHLPGDIVYERGNFRVYVPLATSLLLSVVLSAVFWLMNR
jgi:hypothetical protein